MFGPVKVLEPTPAPLQGGDQIGRILKLMFRKSANKYQLSPFGSLPDGSQIAPFSYHTQNKSCHPECPPAGRAGNEGSQNDVYMDQILRDAQNDKYSTPVFDLYTF